MRPASLPHRFSGVRIEHVRTTAEPSTTEPDTSEEARDRLHDLLDPATDSVGLTLQGKSGVGKTRAACAYLNSAADAGISTGYVSSDNYVRQILESRDIAKVLMNHASERNFTSTVMDDYADRHELLHNLHLAYLPQQGVSRKGLIQFDALVLDDVGREHHTATRFAEDELDALIRGRFDFGLTTIITTNKSPAEWNPQRPALAEIVREACPVVMMLGTNYRD